MGLSASLLFLPGCSRKTAVVQRVALLPANVLVSDDFWQWLKIGVPLVLQQDLMTAHDLIPGVTADESGATQSQATQLLRTTVEKQASGVRITATLVDAKTQAVLSKNSADAASVAGVIGTINSLAKKLDKDASDYSTNNLLALQNYLAAATTNERQQRVHLLNQAVAQDGGFGLPYIALIELLVPSQQVNIGPFVEEAKTHRNKFSAYDRAKFDLAVGRLQAAPAKEQIKQAEEVLKFAPNDLDVIAMEGMNQSLEGDFKGGEASLRRAISLNPANIGLRIQLGRGLMQARQLKQADTVFSSVDKNPAALQDLATCVLLEGNVTRADAIAEKIFASVGNEDVKPLLRASWLVMSGMRQKGVDMLLAARFADPKVKAVALSEASLWQAMGHDYTAAQSSAQQASLAAPQEGSFATVAALLAENQGTSADWQNRVNGSSLPANAKEPLLAYGLFVRGDYEGASARWRKILDNSHGTDLRARAMLWSALDRAGKKGEASGIKVLPFVPEFGDLYAAIPFLEMRRVLSL